MHVHCSAWILVLSLHKLSKQGQGTRDLGSFEIVLCNLVKKALECSRSIVSRHNFLREIKLLISKMTSCFQVWNQSGISPEKGEQITSSQLANKYIDCLSQGIVQVHRKVQKFP